MKITFISDTHNQHTSIKLPSGDILIHSGDLSGTGKKTEIDNFLYWFSNQDYTHKIFIAGNHDFLFEKINFVLDPEYSDNGVIYLQDSLIDVGGLSIYGTPWQPEFFNWAFNLKRNSDELKSKWDMIPSNLDILITHGPPFSIHDLIPEGLHVGCELLRERIEQVKPKIVSFGHIHFSRGVREYDGTLFINASICNESYYPNNEPITIDYDPISKNWDVLYF